MCSTILKCTVLCLFDHLLLHFHYHVRYCSSSSIIKGKTCCYNSISIMPPLKGQGPSLQLNEGCYMNQARVCWWRPGCKLALCIRSRARSAGKLQTPAGKKETSDNDPNLVIYFCFLWPNTRHTYTLVSTVPDASRWLPFRVLCLASLYTVTGSYSM